MNAAEPKSKKLVWAALAAFVIAWLVMDGVLIPPDFGQTDIYYFKDAGINFARGLGLTTRFTYGNPSFAYRDYAHYPPIYPLLFGLYARLAGVSAVSNQVFNSLVAILVGALGFLVLRPLVNSAVELRYRGGVGLALGLSSITIGFYGFAYDRPDGFAVALGIGALLLALRGTSRASAVTAGALCALSLFTSPFTGLWTSLAVALGLLALCEGPLVLFPRRLLYVGLGGGGAVVAVLGLLRCWLPGWFDGFLGVASGSATNNETGGGYFLALLRGDVPTWWSGFAYTSGVSLLSPLKLGAVVAALACMLSMAARRGSRRRLSSLAGLLLASSLCFLIAPYQSNYPAITAALLLATWAIVETVKPIGNGRMAAAGILLAYALNVAMAAPIEARGLAVRSTTGASMRRALIYLETHRSLFDIQDGFVAVSPSNYILWRQAGLNPLISIYSGFQNPANRQALRFLALSYPGSGNPTRPQPAEFVPDSEYIRIFEPVLPQPALIIGHELSRSSQTWESAIYTRRGSDGDQ